MALSSSNQSGIVASVFIALFGLFILTRKVVRAKPSSLSGSRGSRGGASACKGGTTAYAVGLLDIAIPRDDRPGRSFRRVMINDACISRAVQEVSKKLVVTLRDADTDISAGVVRAYVSGLYQEIYDATSAARRPQLDFSVLLPPAINDDGTALSHPGSSSWASREAAELAPDLEMLISDDPRGEERSARLNGERVNLGLSPVVLLSLEAVAENAHNPEYFYAEDVSAKIPTFSRVACGGTFDRLHGGHKKLLTLAASMCPGGTLTVGVTSDALLKSKANAHLITPLAERLKGVENFVRTLNPQLQTRIEEITDPFGPPAVEEAYDAIAVSSETVAGAEKINQLRAQKGFRPLAVAVTRRMAVATLSSTYLRNAAEER